MVLNDAESPVVEAPPSSSTPPPPPSSPPAAPDRTEVMARRFEGAWRYGLAGEATFERMVSPDAEWKAFNGEGGRGAKGVAERLKGMGEFYIDPTFSVTNVAPSGSGGAGGAEAWTVDWMFSGTWPLPWRPRVRVSGVARVETTDEGEVIRRVEDTWTAPKSLGAIVSSQLQPRFFDLLNIFNSVSSWGSWGGVWGGTGAWRWSGRTRGANGSGGWFSRSRCSRLLPSFPRDGHLASDTPPPPPPLSLHLATATPPCAAARGVPRAGRGGEVQWVHHPRDATSGGAAAEHGARPVRA